MNRFRRISSWLLAGLVMFCLAAGCTTNTSAVPSPEEVAYASDDPLPSEGSRMCDQLGALGVDGPPYVDAQAVYMIEAETGDVLYAREEESQLPMASTTKIMTAILACESGGLHRTAIASKAAAYIDGSRIYLREGEPQSLLDLVYAAMLESANDACIVIAEFFDGSIEGFARRMNEKARELGLENTWYVNPHGLPDKGHYTCAKDLAELTRHAMQNDIFREIAATKTREIPLNEPGEGAGASSEEVRNLWNHNKMVFRREDCTGVKPGFTNEAGQCAVVSARRGDTELIISALGSRSSGLWDQLDAMLTWGFERFEKTVLAEKGDVLASLEGERGRTVRAVASRGVTRMLPKDFRTSVSARAEVTQAGNETASGQAIGRALFVLENEAEELHLGSVDLVAEVDAPEVTRDVRPERRYLLGAACVVFAGILYRSIVFEKAQNMKRKNRRLNRMLRRHHQ